MVMIMLSNLKSSKYLIHCGYETFRFSAFYLVRRRFGTVEGNVSPTETNALSPPTVKKGISQAMKQYLERATNYEKFIKIEHEKFEIGKRHLANMMGADPESFSQAQIDEAIEYLFPSSLYDKSARPLMKSPEVIFPKQKEAQFDETGRPFHYLFYTLKPSFYQLLSQIAKKIHEAYAIEDKMLAESKKYDSSLKLNTTGFKLMSLQDLENKFLERITPNEYTQLEEAMARLISLPYSYHFKNFILEWHSPLHEIRATFEIVAPKTDENGKQFVTIYECRRRRSLATVTVTFPGTGLISINGEDINYFESVQSREQILFPLLLTDMVNKVDIKAKVEHGGFSSQAGAIRLGISLALQSFVSSEVIRKLQIAGLLQKDFRRKERKKPGQEGARRKFTWKKR